MVSTLELAGIVYVATGVAELFFLRFALRNRDKPGSLGFGLMVLGMTAWSASVGAGALLSRLGPELFAFNFQLLGAQLVFLGWFLLALEFGDPDRVTRPLLGGLGVLVVGWQAVIWTNPLHSLVWTDARILSGFVDLQYATGWWLFIGSHYLFLFVAVGLLLGAYVGGTGAKRMQAGAFALATVPVFVTSFATIFDWIGRWDVTPFGYLVVFPIVAWALYRARFLEVLPVARKTVLEEMQDAVVILDGDDQVVDFNAAAAALLDLGGSEIGVTGTEVFAHYGDTAQEFADADNVETEITVDDDGEQRQFHLTISPLGGATQTEAGRVIVLREITQLKRRERQLRMRERQFDLLRQVLSRVLRHNLRNDLEVIRSHAATIPEADDGAARASAETIIETADDLASTGENARRLERIIDSEGDSVELDVGSVVERVALEASDRFTDATVEIDVASDASAVADEQLAMAVDSLVENAVVHADTPAPTVSVSVERTADDVVISVADDGPGIPAEELAVLDARGETDLEHGTGAGLWVVTWIVERSGGQLSFDTGPDGTTATIRLPRDDAGPTAGSPGLDAGDSAAGTAPGSGG